VGSAGRLLEKGEQPDEALRRELREEVGLEVGELKVIATRAFKRARQVEIVFSCQAIGETDQLSFEIQEAAWFIPGEFPDELPADQARIINRTLIDGARAQD
jgi:NADH pyrophosphatase NudC (nudix superfamily)